MNTALANLTWKSKRFHSKGMSISNVCFDHFLEWFWCPLRVKRKLNIINCCLVTDYVMPGLYFSYGLWRKLRILWLTGLEYGAMRAFMPMTLWKYFKKSVQKVEWQKLATIKDARKKNVFPCPPQLMSLPHKHPTWFPVFPPILLSCSNEMSRRETRMRLKTTDNNIINFVI